MSYIEAVRKGNERYDKGVVNFTDALRKDLEGKGFILTEQVLTATAYLGTAVASCLTDVSPSRNDASYRFTWRIEDMPQDLDGVILRVASKYPFLEVNYLGESRFNCSVFNYEGTSEIERSLTSLIAVIDNCASSLVQEIEKLVNGSGLSDSSKKSVLNLIAMCGFCKMFNITDTSVFEYEQGTFSKRELKFLKRVDGIKILETHDKGKTYITIRLE